MEIDGWQELLDHNDSLVNNITNEPKLSVRDVSTDNVIEFNSPIVLSAGVGITRKLGSEKELGIGFGGGYGQSLTTTESKDFSIASLNISFKRELAIKQEFNLDAEFTSSNGKVHEFTLSDDDLGGIRPFGRSRGVPIGASEHPGGDRACECRFPKELFHQNP